MDDITVGELLELATTAAAHASVILLCGLEREAISATSKTSPTDLVTEYDRACEALVTEVLTASRRSDAVLGEESGERPGTSGVRWVVDPLDGTTNYIHRHPSFVVSIAAEVNGTVEAAVVHDPSRRERFTAMRGKGAWCDGHELAVAGPEALDLAVVSTGFSNDISVRRRQVPVAATVLSRIGDLRSSGSAAQDLCWVAAGRLDAYYESDTRYWDRAAGTLIASEAGAWVGGPDGGEPSDDLVIAAPPTLAPELRDVLSSAPLRH